MADEQFNAFTMARRQFDAIAEKLGLDQATRELLRNPDREYHFNIPIRMDDGTYRVFRGFRIQHNDARGPCKGGIRFHPHETVDTIRGLSMWMTWKCAVVDIPLGGGKGGIICDPQALSLREQEALCRGWIRQISSNIGPFQDVPAPDVMTNAQHMLWMLDEYEKIVGGKYPGFITGKPLGLGGSLGRTEATGYGIVYMLREALKKMGVDISKTRASVQGFGNVARYVVELYLKYGGTVICVSSWDRSDRTSYTFKKEQGVDLGELLQIVDAYGGIDKEKARERGYEVLPGDDWIKQDVDILIPCAMENQINGDTVGNIGPNVKLVAEGANGPTTPEADKVLRERNLFVIPDFLANSGGVTCSYFEQVQCNMNYFWSREEVLSKLDQKMTEAFHDVYDLALEKGLYMRDSAYMISVSRVVDACKKRGWV